MRLVGRALPHETDAELRRTALHRGRAAAGDDGHGDSRALQGDKPGAVTYVEDLHLLARCAEMEPPVGEHTVDVEHEKPDPAGTLVQWVHRHMTPARSRS